MIPRWVLVSYFIFDDQTLEKGFRYGAFLTFYLFTLGASMFIIWGGYSPSRYEFVGLFWILIYKILTKTFEKLTIPKVDKYMMSFCYMFFLTELWHIYDEVPRILTTWNTYLLFYFLSDMIMIIPFFLLYRKYFDNIAGVLTGTAVIGLIANVVNTYIDPFLNMAHGIDPISVILIQRAPLSIACIGLMLYYKKGVKKQWSI